MAVMTPVGKTGSRLWGDVLAGGGIGLLLGILVGLSAIPVVANLLAAITAATVAFVGLRTQSKSEDSEDASETGRADPSMSARVRVGSFAIFCVLGILSGIFIRAHDLLARPLAERVAEWKTSGFSDAEARAIVLFQDTRITPSGWTIEKDAGPAGSKSSLLYGSATQLCSETEPSKFSDAVTTLKAWEAYGEVWKRLGAVVQSQIPADRQQQTLRALHAAICADQKKD